MCSPGSGPANRPGRAGQEVGPATGKGAVMLAAP